MYPYAERRTDDAAYFLGGPFSQWWTKNTAADGVQFTQFVLNDEDYLYDFNCAEQYMMASKAKLFPCPENDLLFDAIMKSDNPRAQKELGRKVHNFDVDVWAKHARDIVFRGNISKFKNPALNEYLMATENLLLVEGADYDPVWGVKIAWDDPAIEDINNWQGTNWLGQVLMRVREVLRNESDHWPWGYDLKWDFRLLS